MACKDPEREKAFQEKYRAANVERRKQYDHERYVKIVKPARAIAKARMLAKAKKGG